MQFKVPKLNLPKLNTFPKGQFSGFYSFSALRNFYIHDDLEIDCITYDKEDKRPWRYLNNTLPEEELWAQCTSYRSRVHHFFSKLLKPFLPNSPRANHLLSEVGPPIVSSNLKDLILSYQLEPTIRFIKLNILFGKQALKLPHDYFVLYGNRIIELTNTPTSVSDNSVLRDLKSAYNIYYMNKDKAESCKFDIFVDNSFRVFFSERLVIDILKLQPTLQFDPVLMI